MITLLQRVRSAAVEIDNKRVAQIESGLLVFAAVERDDTQARVEWMIDRVLAYRLFSDNNGRMNCSLIETDGGLLLVPQFTLAADTNKGLRPSFTQAASPELGRELLQHALAYAQRKHECVESGVFGADMQVHLVNDGPATFYLRTT